jgi:hypothetical protein
MAIDIHPPRSDERSLGELFGDLTRDTATLVRQEVALAKAEVSQKAADVGKDAGMIAVGGALAYAGLLVLLGAFVLMLALVMPGWAAALIVGALAAGIGAAVAMSGLKKLKNVDPVPRQTMQTLKDDVNAFKEQAR